MDDKSKKPSDQPKLDKPHYYGDIDGVHVFHATGEGHAYLVGRHIEDPTDDDLKGAAEEAKKLGTPVVIIHGASPPKLRHKMELGKSEGGSGDTVKLYHITDNSKFNLDSNFAPEDNSIAVNDRSGQRGIYLTPDVGQWFQGHGYTRPFLAEFHVPKSLLEHKDISGRWGGEKFIPSHLHDQIKLHRVIPVDAHAREEYGQHGWIEGASGKEFDTGKAITAKAWESPFKGYKYAGKDVRDMSSAEVSGLKQHFKQAEKSGNLGKSESQSKVRKITKSEHVAPIRFDDLNKAETKSYYHITPAKNVASIKEKGLVPQVGDRSRKLKEKSGIYLFNSKEDAEDGVDNWLGDEFPEGEPLATLRVDLPKDHPVTADPHLPDAHSFTNAAIHPKHITVESRDDEHPDWDGKVYKSELKKAFLQHDQETKTNLQDHQGALATLPKSLMDWGVEKLVPLKKDDLASIDLHDHQVKVRKHDADLYSGWVEKDGHHTHQFEKVTMPELLAQLHSKLELYGKEKEPVSPTQEDEPDIIKMIEDHMRSRGHEPSPDWLREDEEEIAPHPVKARAKAKLAEIKAKPLDPEAPAPIGDSVTLSQKDIAHGLNSEESECPDCGSQSTPCACFASFPKPTIEYDLKAQKLTILFKSEWDNEAKASFIEDCKLRTKHFLGGLK
jgi:hypothetical protein